MDYRGQGQHHCPSSACAAFPGYSKKNSTQILAGIEELLTQCQELGSEQMQERVRRHLLSQLLCLGRHTLTGVLGTSGRIFCDWSSDYRMYSSQRIEPEKLFAPVRQSLMDGLPSDKPLVAALDDTRLHKSGRKTHGVKYMRDPMGPAFHVNFIKAQRFVQISMACPSDNGMARMVPIDFVHAPTPQKPHPDADEQACARFRTARREMALPKVGAERLHALRNAMDEENQQDRPLWAVVDGGYTNRTFIKNIPPRTVGVGRIRADAKLYHLPESNEGKPGRNRVYGRRASTPEGFRQDTSVPWYRKPAYLICTDPNASIRDVLQAYVWRWDIEVNFRDEKTLLGVGQAQVRHEHSVENVPALAVAAYAMLLTASIKAYGPSGEPDSLPSPKWRRTKRLRASTQSLIQHLRHEVWADAIRFSSFVSNITQDMKPQKLDNTLESALFYATG